jgi:hypothetical protein
VKKSQKFERGLPTELAGLTQNHKKLIGTSNQPIKIKISLTTITSTMKRNQKLVYRLSNIIKNDWNTKPINANENFPKKSILSTLKVKKSPKFG